MIKKIFSILVFVLLFIINGCEKDFNSVIDPLNYQIEISNINTIGSVVYNSSDSSIVLSIQFKTINGLSKVIANIYSPSNDRVNDSPIELVDNGNTTNYGDTSAGDRIYSNKFFMSSNFDNGSYNVEYKIELLDGSYKIIASQHFSYDNGKNNLPPVISNLIQQDTVQTNVQFTFSVKVDDPNGLNDIKDVYYELFRPNGTKVINSQGISQFPLFDDGNTSANGDVTAADGRYTVFLTFPTTVSLGSWKFEFTAVDKAGHTSNKISHNVEVK